MSILHYTMYKLNWTCCVYQENSHIWPNHLSRLVLRSDCRLYMYISVQCLDTIAYCVYMFYLKTAAGSRERCHGVWRSVPREDRPDPQELQEAVQPADRCGGMGTGHHHQHAYQIFPHSVPGPQQGCEYCYTWHFILPVSDKAIWLCC